MEFNIKSGSIRKQRTACLIVGVYERRKLTPAAAAIDKAGGRQLSALIRRGDIDGGIGQSLILHNPAGVLADRVLLTGCGREGELDDAGYRRIIGHSIRQVGETGALDAVSYLLELDVAGRALRWKIYQAALTMRHGLYAFHEFKSKRRRRHRTLRRFTLIVGSRRELAEAEEALMQGEATARGIALTRDLANRPGNACTPTHLARQAQRLGRAHKALKVKVLGEAEMKRLGMESLLSVSQGSAQPAKLISMEYRGAGRAERPIVLIGKGITFDTGGISIKPSAAMDEMKFDMCGAAAVLGTVCAVMEMGLAVNLVGLVAASENMPGSRATKPGDIFTSMSGQTIEVLNTDAEGRLVLCDALTYAQRFKPEVVIDIATLTGACVVALGKHATGLMSNHEPLAKALLQAGEASGDRAWQLPLWEDYEKQLHSPFADMANIGGRDGGAITAGCFLAKFARNYRWAHLDIAGTAWVSGKNKSATGRPVALLTQYLLDSHRR